MEMAIVTASRSTCLRRAVGCVLLSERGHVLATGYNGVAAGQKHCNEKIPYSPTMKEGNCTPNACPGAFAVSGTQLDACQAIHAEQNALLQCHDVYQIQDCFVTTSPCVTCVKLLLNTGCRRIVFGDEYPHPEAQLLWEAAGRTWVQLKLEL